MASANGAIDVGLEGVFVNAAALKNDSAFWLRCSETQPGRARLAACGHGFALVTPEQSGVYLENSLRQSAETIVSGNDKEADFSPILSVKSALRI